MPLLPKKCMKVILVSVGPENASWLCGVKHMVPSLCDTQHIIETGTLLSVYLIMKYVHIPLGWMDIALPVMCAGVL